MDRGKHNTIPPGIVGFRNLGNTCYLNATLQCLLTIEPFNRWITILSNRTSDQANQNLLTNGKSMAKSLALLIESIWSNKYDENYLVDLRQLLGTLCEEYKSRTEQDAQEVLLFIINRLDQEFSGQLNSSFDSNNDLDLNQVRQMFAGLQKTHVVCPNVACGAKNALPPPGHKNKIKKRVKIFSINKFFKPKSTSELPQDAIVEDCDTSNPDYLFYCLSLTLPNDFYAHPDSTDAPPPSELAITFVPAENNTFSSPLHCHLKVTLNPLHSIHSAYQLVYDQIKERYPFAVTVIVQATSWGFGTIFLNTQELASQLFAEPDSDASYFQSETNGSFQIQPILKLPYPKGSILSSSALFAMQLPEKVPDLNSLLSNDSSDGNTPVESLPPDSPKTRELVTKCYQNSLNDASSFVQLLLVHVARASYYDPQSQTHKWSSPNPDPGKFIRFSAPIFNLVDKTVSFDDLQEAIIEDLVIQCQIKPEYSLNNILSQNRINFSYWICDSSPGVSHYPVFRPYKQSILVH